MAKIDKKGRMIAIADYLFANPSKERADVLSKFGKTWQMSDRTVDRIIKEAKEYNLERIREQEKAKGDILIKKAKESITDGIISREESLRILSDIANGKTRTESDETIVPTDGDRIRAVQQLAKMSGWETPLKVETDQTITIEYLGIDE